MGTFAKPPPSCAFCGAAGPLTKEDAWPRWLNKALAAPAGPGIAIDMTVEGPSAGRLSKRTVNGYNTARVPGFCALCNNGWMSDLEEAAMPILLPMICGTPTTLSPADQGLIATWVTKTALVFDHRTKDRAPLVGATIKHAFGRRQQPIPGSRVSLGHYVGDDWQLNHSVGGLDARYGSGSDKTVVAIITLSLGALVMQLVAPTDPGEASTVGALHRDDARIALRLEPPPSVPQTWPPQIGMASRDWYEFGLSTASKADIDDLLATIRQLCPPRLQPLTE